MKPLALIGIVLIAIGLAALIYGEITYSSQEQEVKVGPIEVTAKTKKTIPLPPIVGGVAIAGGVVLLIVGIRRV